MRPARLRGISVVATLAAGLLFVGGCRRETSSEILRVGHETDVLTIDPIAASDGVTNSVLANLYEPLVAFDRDMVLGPKLAEVWETTGPTTWVLRVRAGIRFQDGTPLAAHDVRLSLERARNDATSAIKGSLYNIRTVEEVDERTIAITTSRPDPLLLNRLAQVPIIRIVEGRFVGTGPYRVVRFAKGAPTEVEAFPGYWGGPPRIARVRFVTVPPGQAMLDELRGRKVDLLRFVPETLLDDVAKIPGVRIGARAGLTSTYLWMDTRPGKPRNPFADARVRRAVSLAVDRAAIVKGLAGNALTLEQTVPRGIFGHVASLPQPRTDLEESRRLLREAGYPNGFDTPLTHTPGPTAERVAELLRDRLGEVGIRVTLHGPKWQEIFEGWRNAQLPFFMASWRFDNGDAASFLQDCLVTRNGSTGFGGNNAGYSNPALDRLVEESERVVEPAKRLALYEEIARLLAADVPVVPLYHRYNLFAISDRLKWEPRLDGRVLVVDVSLTGGR